MLNSRLLPLGLALALVVPAAAAAKPDKAAKPTKPPKVKTVTYVFKGTWNADGTVLVKKGNAHVRKAHLVGGNVAFDLTKAKLVVADTNADGKHDAADLQAGDKVLVQARLPRKVPGDAPYSARKLVDQTHPPTADEAPESPAPVQG
jgi:hypothetical protein